MKENEWINILKSDKKPSSYWIIVLVTDGELICLARWIENPIDWYGQDLEDDDGEKIEDEFHTSHWAFETEIGPFIEGQECFGRIEDIIAWMPLPKPPEMNHEEK